MENPMLVVVINDLPLLLNNPDLAQLLLDLAHAELDLSAVYFVEAAAQLKELRRLETLLRTFPMPAEERIACAAAIALVAANVDVMLELRRQLAQVVVLLVAVWAAASARRRAHLLLGPLLAAASAAVVPGFRSFVRFSVLILGLLFRF